MHASLLSLAAGLGRRLGLGAGRHPKGTNRVRARMRPGAGEVLRFGMRGEIAGTVRAGMRGEVAEAVRTGMRLAYLLTWVLAVLGEVGFPASAAASDLAYLASLEERAERQHLAELPEWRALLHYHPLRLSRGVASEIDDPAFFLSPRGKYDPRQELLATLASFFQPPGEDPDQSPQCRYPARYHFLSRALAFDEGRLPQVSCPRLQRWLGEMNPGELTLVFPAAYLNNPASMFGHTLLRVDPPEEDRQPPLLANTINYAAATGDQKGVTYAVKGLFGGYRGRFSIAPYYAAVKSYGDIENRDIWEYRLDLNRDEIGQLLRHTWEMRAAWFDYYFLDENCSYHLLALLEVVRPGLRLTEGFSGWTIPSETVRAVAEAGLVREVRFRPARNTVILRRMRLLDAGSQELAGRMARQGLAAGSASLAALPPARQAQVLELAADYLVYLQSPRFGSGRQEPGRLAELLKARSRLDVPDQTPVLAAPAVWPGSGHRPARVRLGYGSSDRRQFLELSGSPAYHDTSDPQGGFTRGSRVNLLAAALRYYPEQNQVLLERLDILDLMSLSSWNRFMHPVSWKVALGLARKDRAPGDRPLLGSFSAGGGVSHDFNDATSAYAFGEGIVEMSGRFAYLAAPGVGARLGVAHSFTPRWRSEARFLWQFFFLHESRNDLEAVLENRVELNSRNLAGVDLWWKREFGNSFPGVKVYWQYFF